jgi:hypothetical protein
MQKATPCCAIPCAFLLPNKPCTMSLRRNKGVPGLETRRHTAQKLVSSVRAAACSSIWFCAQRRRLCCLLQQTSPDAPTCIRIHTTVTADITADDADTLHATPHATSSSANQGRRHQQTNARPPCKGHMAQTDKGSLAVLGGSCKQHNASTTPSQLLLLPL